MLGLILAVTILLHPGKPPGKAGPSIPGTGMFSSGLVLGVGGTYLQMKRFIFSQPQEWGIVPFCMPRGGE